jgi:hypothetical protein
MKTLPIYSLVLALFMPIEHLGVSAVVTMHSVVLACLEMLKIRIVSVRTQKMRRNQKKRTMSQSSVCVMCIHLFLSSKHPEMAIDCMSKKWDAPIYVFFKPSATIEYVGKCKVHVFECATARCHCKSKFIWQFLYTSDAGSMSNMHRHVKVCWGDDAVTAADTTGNI